MAGFMNAELESIRDNLRCGHCEAIFKGSDSQARKVKYERGVVYCSTICRHAALKNKFGKPVPNRGPCPTCSKEFFSRTAKKFCSMDCYTKSPQLLAMIKFNTSTPEARAKNAEVRRNGEFKPCLECGTEIYQKPATPRKFCSKICYRAYMARRFDRWVANPEGLALPQCYDEFLDREELTCPIDGCSWHGRFLTMHVNLSHGLPSQDFKRAAGFNLGSGLVSKPLARAMSERALVGVAAEPVPHEKTKKGTVRSYRSKEAVEHSKKSYSLARAYPGPCRQCKGCGKSFTQSTRFGRALYCSRDCRRESYARNTRAVNKKPRTRRADGTFSSGFEEVK